MTQIKKTIFFAAVLSLAGCGSLTGLLSGEKTVYPVLCDGEMDLEASACKVRLRTLSRIAFRVSVDRQEVIYRLPGVNETPYTLRGCTVRDSDNWRCEEGVHGFSRTVMEGGHISGESKEGVYYVPWWRWWSIELAGIDPGRGAGLVPR